MLAVLCSFYLEGPLADATIRSALATGAPVIVFEGPAGPPLENAADCPVTDYGEWHHAITLVRGAWKSDAAKRTAMVEYCRRYRPEPVWGLLLDGDEVLCNPEFLADHIRSLEWTNDPDAPWMGWPIKLVELDGGVTVCRGKVVRVDLIDSYSVSSSVFTNALGYMHGEGNYPLDFTEHRRPIQEFIDGLPPAQAEQASRRLWLPPPLPCEPFLMHRSALRHPARAGLRLHEQEASELGKARNGDAALAHDRDEDGEDEGLTDPGLISGSDTLEQVVAGRDGDTG